jgi:hypothetical protein
VTVAALAPITLRLAAPPVATAGNDLVTPVAVSPCAGTVIAVRYCPVTVLTGAVTNNRTLTLFNRGLAGAGVVAVATKNFTTGVNIAAKTQGDITLGVAANLVLALGDVLEWESLHVGTGIADPGGVVEVVIQPGLG